jgi:hypothetical protein
MRQATPGSIKRKVNAILAALINNVCYYSYNPIFKTFSPSLLVVL